MKEAEMARPAQSSARVGGSYILSGLILAAGLALTFATTEAIHLQAHKQASIALQSQVNMLSVRIERKFLSLSQLLSGAQAFLASDNEIDASRWRRFTASLDFEKAYPGALAIGYTALTGANDNLELQTRGRYLAPLSNSNRHLIGYDLASNEEQRRAMIRARDFGQMTVSTTADLRQLVGSNSPSGLVLYMPVYQDGETPDWISSRRARLLGFVYLVADDSRILKETMDTSDSEIAALRLYDGLADGTGTLLDERSGTLRPDEQETYASQITVAGRQLTLSLAAPVHAELEHNTLTRGLTSGGLLLSLLLALTSWFQVAGRRREQQLIALNEQLAWTQRKAEQANLAKSAFLATMSHEIRTPMNGVIGMIDVLAAGELTARQQGMVSTVRQSGLSLLRLVDDILDFSKIESDMLYVERIEFELEPLVKEVGHSLYTIAADKQVCLSLYLDPRLPALVWGDPTRLKQILFNLVGNAIKFSSKNPDEAGHVSLRFLPDADCNQTVQIEVIDNGIGMTPETIETLFDAFTQAEVSTTRRFGGSGLGLAICKRLIEMADGSVEVHSELHHGSRFRVRLPMLASNTPATPTRPTAANLAGVVCILFENESGLISNLQAYLEAAGAKTNIVQAHTELNDMLLQQRTAPTVVIGAPTDLADYATDASSQIDCSEHVEQVMMIRAGSELAAPQFDGAARTERAVICLSRLDLLPTSFIEWTASIAGLQPAPDQFETTRLRDKQRSLSNRAADGEMTDKAGNERNDSEKAKILVAEDEPINQQVITRQLEILGYDVDVADNGIAALRYFHAGAYDLVLTDLHMPDMDGYELTRAIRGAQQPDERIPILMLSANAINGESARAASIGVDEYLTKPIQIEMLAKALGRWLAGQATSHQPDPAPGNTQNDEPKAAPTLDPEVLNSLVDDDQAMANSVTRAFQHSIVSAKAEMSAAQSANDVRQIQEIAHRIKSSARTVGALALGYVCAELETAAERSDLENVQASLPEFYEACAEVTRAIESLLEIETQ